MNLILKMVSENEGEISTIRVMSIFSLLVGAGVACYGIHSGKDLGGVAQICGVFVGAAFAGKVAQKYGET